MVFTSLIIGRNAGNVRADHRTMMIMLPYRMLVAYTFICSHVKKYYNLSHPTMKSSLFVSDNRCDHRKPLHALWRSFDNEGTALFCEHNIGNQSFSGFRGPFRGRRIPFTTRSERCGPIFAAIEYRFPGPVVRTLEDRSVLPAH